MDMFGRAFDGIGRPCDNGPDIIPEKRLGINGTPINPAARDSAVDVIQTGIPAIDGLNALALGHVLPIFSSPGLPHARLAAHIACRAAVSMGGNAAVVLGAIGAAFDEVDFYMGEFQRTGIIERAVLYISKAGGSPIERIAAPRTALTAAEYLAFEKGMHALVILTDIANYADALCELSAARGELPGRLGYPNGMHADLASIYERAGRMRGRAGSLTLIPVITLPRCDMAHPIVDFTGCMADGQIVLSREQYKQGEEFPVDALQSFSRTNF
jgi:V/A-type H+-transporting ATPase subunit B